MAVGMLLAGEGVTREAYVALTEKMFGNYPVRPDQTPEGLILHTAGETPEGWYIYDVWESKEQFMHFFEGRVQPGMQEITADQPGGEPPQPQFFDIETIVGPE